MLNVDTAPEFLIKQGLITTQSILHGDLSITSAARRNRNLRVTRKDGVGYLVKQPDDPTSGGLYSLRCEAAFYAFCHHEPGVPAIQTLLPRLMLADYESGLAALELIEGALPLWSYYNQFAPANFPAQAAALVGQALGIIHRAFRQPDLLNDERLTWLRRDVPWILQVHKPGPEMLATISAANYQIIQILQTQPGLSRQLDELRKVWQPGTIVHNDIKSDNILVLPGDGTHPLQVRIVDWELVQAGDPAWDLAGILQDFVLFWLFSMTAANASPDEMVASARYPLPTLQIAVRALSRAYRTSAELTSGEGNTLFARAARFSAARLIQSAYEMGQGAQALPAHAVLLLQISANLLADPELVQIQLYGLFQEVNP